MARLVGVPAPVHVRQIERADRLQRARFGEELADRGEAANLDAENILTLGEDMTHVFRRHDAALEKGVVHLAVIERTVGSEIG